MSQSIPNCFFWRGVRFQYPPSALFALSGMQLIAAERVRTSEIYSGPEPTINALLDWLFLVTMGWAAAALLE